MYMELRTMKISPILRASMKKVQTFVIPQLRTGPGSLRHLHAVVGVTLRASLPIR